MSYTMQQAPGYETTLNSMYQSAPTNGQNTDYSYMNQHPATGNVSAYSQPPPPYASVIQSPPYRAPAPQQPQALNNILTTAPAVQTGPVTPTMKEYKWPRKSVALVCSKCGAAVTTRVERSITLVTLVAALLLCFCTCLLGVVPFLLPMCKRSTHYCPYCGSQLGVRRAIV